MPTPSNPPPNPEPSHSQNFSTCPEDGGTRPPPRAWESSESADEPSGASMEVHDDHAAPQTEGAVPASSTVRQGATGLSGATGTDTMVEDDPTSTVSSRSTTMSPAPGSTVTARTTPPISAAPVQDAAKPGEAPATDGPSRQSASGSSSSARRSQHPLAMSQSQAEKDTEAGYEEHEDGNLMAPSMGADYPSMRSIATSPSSYLRPGSKFHGTQQSERQVYDVQVDIKQVDLKESFLCGYLRIQGLTEDHPTLTTYFEGEIIGTKYNFFTNHDGWGATNKIDLSHWKKFTAFRPFEKQARKGPVPIRDIAQREVIFMRWKEHFLVPDHRVRTISGASFEGFYYICFNQLKGEVSGIYFHAKSEKFQQLELTHVENKGCFSSLEFR